PFSTGGGNESPGMTVIPPNLPPTRGNPFEAQGPTYDLLGNVTRAATAATPLGDSGQPPVVPAQYDLGGNLAQSQSPPTPSVLDRLNRLFGGRGAGESPTTAATGAVRAEGTIPSTTSPLNPAQAAVMSALRDQQRPPLDDDG